MEVSLQMHRDFFVCDENIEWKQLDEKTSRKVLAYDPSLMMVKVHFLQGSVGAIHQHEHVQLTYIESGVFEVFINNQTQILKAGDAFYIPSNTDHGVKCIKEGVLIDAFSPLRPDFL